MASPLDIFSSQDTLISLNTRMTNADRDSVQKAVELQNLKSHIWLASSGTENAQLNTLKIVALSKEAFLIAADSVCKTFEISSQDNYYNTLPLFHVGGLSTLARAYVSGGNHIQSDEKWNASQLVKTLEEKKITITSLVPTQMFDIVTQRLHAPPILRFVFIGGGALSEELEVQARSLGWSTVLTYGMTETAAMLAYKKQRALNYNVFPHIDEVRTTVEGRLQIRSRALLSGYLFVGKTIEFKDPKVDGWFTSGDMARVESKTIELLGRESELVKIKGETVSLLEINQLFESYCLKNNISGKTVILAVPHARDGFELLLVRECNMSSTQLSQFNQTQLPFCRIAKSVTLDKIPTTAVGKVDIAATRALI